MDNQHRRISGYRDLTQAEIDFMNQAKAKAQEVGDLVDEVLASSVTDKRWASIAKTQLQQGFMALVRSIAQPTTF